MTGQLSATAYPLSQFVLKVHGRCDLSCDHCYVYENADQSWRVKPVAMSVDVVHAAAARIGAHAAAWGLPAVHVVIHGGEPLLLGLERMRAVLAELSSTITAAAPLTRLSLVMQTNAVRLDPAMCDVLKEYGVRVGVSLDGDRLANDRHRRFANGNSSFDKVRTALALLRTPKYRELYAGILCTVDIRNDPEAVYRAIAAEEPPGIDFLLPHAHWGAPPYRPDGDPTPYATWLAVIHGRWLADGKPMHIRMFDSLHSTAGGGRSGSEQLGTDPADLAVIDTNGDWEQSDAVKTSFDGAPGTGMNVLTHSVDQVSAYPAIAMRQEGAGRLSETCRACPVVAQCGGGLYAHRYRPGHGFDNPSVYCDDLSALVSLVNAVTAPGAADAKPDDPALPPGLFDQVATGHGDEATMAWLARAELTITRSLLFSVVGLHGRTDAWDVLNRVEADRPDEVHRILRHPYVRVWAVDQLGEEPAGDPGHLAVLAAAAAVRAGLGAEIEVPVQRGVLHLPTVGTVYWPAPVDTTARLVSGPEGFTVRGPDRTLEIRLDRPAQPHWQPARWVELDGWRLRIEDGDPLRDCHQWPVAGRLGDDDDRAWRAGLAEAWRIIADEVPGYVPGLRHGLHTVVPLEADPAGAVRASTARNAFGSVASVLTDPAELAVVLTHEFQHGKLGALLDLVDLFDTESPVRLRVGWRPDPRPIEGVLQGVYAHAAVADVWGVRARRADDPVARETFQRYHGWTVAALEALRDTDALTPLGRRFVDRLGDTVAERSAR
ncbi:FxsB family cyclophane-forming radical SAM/SPASM peptide maturase [Dactylosporangium sp. AC04546]|uniref:FxsB family cyclophane-forming radical SAM/SPASM peptide maturase n=1 Tax=Dactylosporangium sp. AC04546 TaxID=2862460 RepID=UPI001EDE3307|nr:FxsB family cyclophane-forming radical SAM/SPASM peptide maturase [Dactylosporangium sp. AC04546]WVK83536.1 FxsB family cyclophane-forming radical SAM/SPASM peptide maturase [Dactylosporangium sp. AC04546]